MEENLNNKEAEEVLAQPATIEKVTLDSIQNELETIKSENESPEEIEKRELAFIAIDNIVKSFMDLTSAEKKAVIELIKSGKIKF